MHPITQLKLCAIMFTVLWTGWMLWSSGSLERANVIVLSVCGVAAGYAWYLAMRWQFQRGGMLVRDDHPADVVEKR
jgi:hypothetical protein